MKRRKNFVMAQSSKACQRGIRNHGDSYGKKQ